MTSDVDDLERKVQALEREVRHLREESTDNQRKIASLDNTLARVRHWVERKFGVTI